MGQDLTRPSFPSLHVQIQTQEDSVDVVDVVVVVVVIQSNRMVPNFKHMEGTSRGVLVQVSNFMDTPLHVTSHLNDEWLKSS
jgi:hypothetical protein